MAPSPEVALRRFALARATSLAVKLAAVAVVAILVVKVLGGF